MKIIRSSAIAVAVTAVLATAGFAGTAHKTAGPEVVVLFPDSGGRWATLDRPYLAAALRQAGLSYSIGYAGGSAVLQRAQGQQAIADGAKVILLTNVDSPSGAAIERNAMSHGVKVIDYDG